MKRSMSRIDHRGDERPRAVRIVGQRARMSDELRRASAIELDGAFAADVGLGLHDDVIASEGHGAVPPLASTGT